jgi:Zn-dependent M28 family amino/carboxypeptidase
VTRQTYDVHGVACTNLVAELRGRRAPSEVVVVGAHYDSARTSPGANDNGSGTVSLLALAHARASHPLGRTVRYVFFVNEEPPYFFTRDMGSRRYVASLAAAETIVAMLALETIGSFFDAPGSQRYPFPLNLAYPDRGDFIAIVGKGFPGK